ncbi:SAP domain-containing protein [Fructilactobacillus sp. Tb1]|uniref:SAP domain-containing protein n=1 Tax=Fructilactobacillus sp. Tb1 TaxID=3422304 RepID=UPI003D27BF99
MDIKEFKSCYFYKTDLMKMCNYYNLPTYGTKAELESYIIKYLNGIDSKNIHPLRKRKTKKDKLKSEQITINTKLLESGFSLNREARKFFCSYYNVNNFHFKKSMAIKLREVERNNDLNATVLDLIKAKNNKIIIENDEEKTYQWNNFLKSFCESNESNQFINKIKVASILWNYAKQETISKKYEDALINLKYDDIKKYKKIN